MKINILKSKIEGARKKVRDIIKRRDNQDYGLVFREVGEELKELFIHYDDGRPSRSIGFVETIIVEIDGYATSQDWEFIGVIEHTDHGNIIRTIFDIEVPEIYRTRGKICDHCNKVRRRNDTFLVRNTKTGEFRQVGKTCLFDYTDIAVSSALRVFEAIDKIYKDYNYSNYSYDKISEKEVLYSKESYLLYVIECVKKFGYNKSSSISKDEYKPTYQLAIELYNYINTRSLRSNLLDNIIKNGFNPCTEENMSLASSMLSWINSDINDSQYIHNLRVVSNKNFLEYRDLSLIASLPSTYRRYHNAELNNSSEFVGDIGDRIDIEVSSAKVLRSIENNYGISYLHQIIDNKGNIFIWWSHDKHDFEGVNKIRATVKSHNIYQGLKQTHITRCKSI